MKDKDKIIKYVIGILIGISLIVVTAILGMTNHNLKEEYEDLLKDNDRLRKEIAEYIKADSIANDVIKKQKHRIDSLQIIYNIHTNKISILIYERDSLRDKINNILPLETYDFLQLVAYPYPGELNYPFNELQIREIRYDYEYARNSEKLVPNLMDQLENMGIQTEERDKIIEELRKINIDHLKIISDYKTLDNNNKLIIRNIEKDLNKQKTFKNIFMGSTGALTIAVIILAL